VAQETAASSRVHFFNSNRGLTPCRLWKGSVSVAKDGTYRGGRRIRAGSKPDSAADKIVCTDPPYLVNLESTSGKIKNDDLNDKDGYEFLKKAFSCFHDVMAKDASIYVLL